MTDVPATTSYSCSGIQNQQILLKILPVVLSGPLGQVHTFALLDDGSTATLIDANIANQIGATGPLEKIRIQGITGIRDCVEVRRVTFDIRGKNCDNTFTIRGAHTLSSLSLKPQTISAQYLMQHKHLRDIVEQLSYDNVTPKVLIGINDWHLLISRENRAGTSSQLAASRTALGWVLFGCTSNITKPILVMNHCVVDNQYEELNNLIKDYFRLESIGIKPCDLYSAQDKRALEILEKTTKRLPNDRFETGLLWKNDSFPLPNSYYVALHRLNNLHKKFSRDIQYAELYKLNIDAYVDKEYAEPCLDNHNVNNSSSRWYMPHFGVTHPNKPGKLRIVYDAAAKSSGISLNSLLLSGPDLLQSLIGILLRFREGQIALTADIREMFSRIKIRESDRDYQRYLWKVNGEIKEFRMSSLIFGATSSPCSAIFVKNKNAMEFESEFPEAARAIIHDHYMDDYLGSVDDEEHAAHLAADIVHIHSKAGFEMRGWTSNSTQALKLLPENLLKINPNDLNLDLDNLGLRVLGLFWNNMTDTFSFKLNIDCPIPKKMTKRQVLRDLMRIYDPLGFLGPIITRAKVLFQKTWHIVDNWDTVLPQIECDQWGEWYRDLESIQSLKIPRCYLITAGPIDRELHVFTDASSVAYACVAYWRFIYSDGSIKLTLIGSKSRVSPLKPTSIPRLELQAALLGAKFSQTICREHKYKPTRKLYWCDSRTVLSWIRSDARNFKPFVAHRIGEIGEITEPNEWRWVSTDLNVADDATRINAKGFSSLSRWLNGPTFLLSTEIHWPMDSNEPIDQCMSEIKCKNKNSNIFVQTNFISNVFYNLVPNCNKFSGWYRLLRATARAHQYIRLLRDKYYQKDDKSPNRKGLHPLLIQDKKAAEIHILRQSQMESFKEELLNIQRNEAYSKNSRLKNLPCKLDDNGLLRLHSRISAAKDVDINIKTPIILDGRHHSTKLIIEAFHIWAGHANNETVVNEVRQRYWVIRLRPTVRSIARDCQVCRVKKATSIIPPTGDLPPERLGHHSRPFTFAGLDYFGPIMVSEGRKQLKRYVALFTCLVTRAVHLEIVSNLTSDAAIMALRRFMARRGCPSKILSDNGTAFIGANRELKKSWQEIDHNNIQNFAVTKGIEWKFIPPASPFMGGAWERLVKTVKSALTATLKEKSPREEILSTLLLEAEHVVNSRPLTHVSVSADDQEALTPNHFLLGSSSGLPLHTDLDDRDLLRRSDWRKALRLADHFWSRWLKEYLPTLAPRHQPNAAVPNLAVGDLVFIADGNMPRGVWPRGRIVATYPGKDGVVRVADVNTAAGILKRPVRKLVKIPVEIQEVNGIA